MKTLILLTLGLTFVGCSSIPNLDKRIFIDSTNRIDDPPAWVTTAKIIWEKDSKIFLRSTYTVNGNDRVNGCYDLAKLDTKEALLSEIANDISGRIDNAQQSISEDAEIILGKVRSAEFDGRVSGLRFEEQYFERYRIGELERIDCHVLAQISKADYNMVKRQVINRIKAVDPRLREAITRGQIDFFAKGDSAGHKSSAQQTEE